MKSQIKKLRAKAESLRDEADDVDWEADELQKRWDAIKDQMPKFEEFLSYLEGNGTFREQEVIRSLVQEEDFEMKDVTAIMHRHSFELQ